MDRKKKHALLLGLILVILGGALLLCYFQGWLPQANAQETTTQRSTILMDTVVDVRVDGRNSQALVEQAFERMAELEALFSRFVPESEVSAINRGAGLGQGQSPHPGAHRTGFGNGPFDRRGL